MLKSYRVVVVVVAHMTLLSAPVPVGIGIRGPGLGLDNFNVYLRFCFCPFQLSSYGGYLEFTLRFVPSPGEEEPSDGEALVELSVC